jgi:hypothetical protein
MNLLNKSRLVVVRPHLILVAVLTCVTVASPQVETHRATSVQHDESARSSALNFGLGALPLLSGAETRSVSAENPTGEKGKGAMAIPKPGDPDQPHSFLTAQLGQGWKTRPFLAPKAGQTVTLLDVDGPGVVEHIWMVTADAGFLYHGRSCVLRMYWDGEATPSVEVPVSDFFAVGHDTFAPVDSVAIAVNPGSAMNSFWPMPFRKHARITFTNESAKDMPLLAYQITYDKAPVQPNAAYFHAQWRRNSWQRQNPYVILDGICGSGRYVGTVLEVEQLDDNWFGEGEVKFYLDGDSEFPTIAGTGTEDYFLFSYGFPTTRSALYSGVPLRAGVGPGDPGGRAGAKWTMYRWHILDPINFQQDLKITIQGLGGLKGHHGFAKRHDDVASVAYWYQTEPHAPFPTLPSVAERVSDSTSELPLWGFDIKSAIVRDEQKRSHFEWTDLSARNTDFQLSYRGYQASDDPAEFFVRGVATEVDRRQDGFILQADRSADPVIAEWEMPLPKGTKLTVRYAPTIDAAIHTKGIRFSVFLVSANGSRRALMESVLNRQLPAAVREQTFLIEDDVKSIAFQADSLSGGNADAVWFVPEVHLPGS